MSQIEPSSSSSTDLDDLYALAQRGASVPSGLNASEVARVCAALLQCLDDADDVILRSRWHDSAASARRPG